MASQIIEWNGHKVDVDRALMEITREECEESLYTFLMHAWRFIDPAPFKPGWVIDALAEHLEAVVDGDIKRLLINIPPRCSKSSICSVAFPAWVWAQSHASPTSGPSVALLHASYAHSLALRDSVKCRRLIKSTWYQRMWGDRFRITPDQDMKIRFQNDKGGERLITSVDAGVTGEGGNIIIVDDPNNAKEVLSEAVIQSTNEDWWDGTMSTRLNDPKTGAYIVVQQRLGESDLTGHILAKEAVDWTHLMLPMEFETDRSFATVIGWEDPRVEEGELLWPERFGQPEVNKLKSNLGSWKCNPGEAPVLMTDLSMKRIDQVKVGDSIIGFAKKTRTDTYGRMRLVEAKVTEIHSHVAPVVKMTLDSGEVIRCTHDHKWFAKDKGGQRPMYLPVTLGRSALARVCPPRMPELSPEDQHLAGWLAGFFDGEGTVSVQKREDDQYEPGNTIAIYQGAGRNLPLCEKLERVLRHFGFEFTMSEDERKPNKNAPCYGYRCYRLKNGGVPTLQRFLHVIKPTKWRDRLESAARRANFIQRREKVISIEPDGEEVVYGLTTTTGNYVVWGLASSNSAGQLQQRPEPKGGGIIKRDWWRLWPPEGETFNKRGEPVKPLQNPPCSFIVASLDTAYTEKTMNDPSALTIWGVFAGDPVAQEVRASDEHSVRVYTETSTRVILLHAWTKHLEIHPLVNEVAKSCKAFNVDKLLIEDKASGHSVAQELRRLFSNESWAVQLINPKNLDKLARLYSVQHLWEEGMIYAPERTWAEAVITQMGTFPNAAHDDLVDTASQALRHLRDIGLLQRGVEITADVTESVRHTGRPQGRLYPS